MAPAAQRVVVTDASQRVALEIVRCLGRARHTVIAVESNSARSVPTFASRYCHETARPAPGEPLDEFLLHQAGRADVLIPVSTNTVILVADRLDDFRSRCAVLVPPAEIVRKVIGKASIIAAAENVGVPVPRTVRPSSVDDLDTVSQKLDFPLVVKLADDENLYLAPQDRYGFAGSLTELRALWTHLHGIKPRPVVQQRIQGPGIGFSTVLGSGGEFLGAVAHERIREYPISGGPSTCCVSIHDPHLMDLSLRLLRSVGWIGPAMVEYKRDLRDGSYRLLEINPRFWGSIPLARLAGLNLPAAMVDYIAHGRVPEERLAATGVKMRILPKDVLAGVGYLAAGRVGDFGGFVRDLFDPRVRPGLFDLTDPKPALFFLRGTTR